MEKALEDTLLGIKKEITELKVRHNRVLAHTLMLLESAALSRVSGGISYTLANISVFAGFLAISVAFFSLYKVFEDADFLIGGGVTLAIAISFFVSAWRENRQNKKLLEEMRSSLDDTSNIIDDLLKEAKDTLEGK